MTASPRFDIYALIHKALRAAMGEVLTAVGRMDALDDDDTSATLARVRALLKLARAHLEQENRFIHPALEARSAGASATTAHDHEQQLPVFATLDSLVMRTEQAQGHARIDAAKRLYLELALFIAENLKHMHVEETKNTQSLWAVYSDEELMAIRDSIVASQTPAETAEVIGWMVPSASPLERAFLLGDIQKKAPAKVFSGLLEVVHPRLSTRDWDKLMNVLAPLPAAV